MAFEKQKILFSTNHRLLSKFNMLDWSKRTTPKKVVLLIGQCGLGDSVRLKALKMKTTQQPST